MTYATHQQPFPLDLPADQVYVFASELTQAGSHPTALHALQHYGALSRVGRGWSGQSFALPCYQPQQPSELLPLTTVQQYLDDFKIYTEHHPGQTYYLATFTDMPDELHRALIRALNGISANVILPETLAHELIR